MADLGAQLRDRLASIRETVWRERDRFTVDHHTDRLVAFFRDVILHHAGGRTGTAAD